MPTEIEKMVPTAVCAKKLGCRINLVSAVKRRLNITSYKVFPSVIYKYLLDNPEFKETDVYRRKTPGTN